MRVSVRDVAVNRGAATAHRLQLLKAHVFVTPQRIQLSALGAGCIPLISWSEFPFPIHCAQ
jgi:hypothetical protein